MKLTKIPDGWFMHVTPKEALEIIESLSQQMICGSSNSGRREFYTDKRKYFSIAVQRETGGEG